MTIWFMNHYHTIIIGTFTADYWTKYSWWYLFVPSSAYCRCCLTLYRTLVGSMSLIKSGDYTLSRSRTTDNDVIAVQVKLTDSCLDALDTYLQISSVSKSYAKFLYQLTQSSTVYCILDVFFSISSTQLTLLNVSTLIKEFQYVWVHSYLARNEQDISYNADSTYS